MFARLLELFYGKADSLWQAKMGLKAEGHPIKDWAGWVLTGEPE